MKVTILGASPVVPNPNGACTGLLVQSGPTALLLDCGSGVVGKLQRHLDFHQLAAVLITHMHADHFLDLVSLRYALKYAPWAGGSPRLPLHLPPQGSRILHTIGSVLDEEGADFFSEEFRVQEYAPDQPLTIGGLRLTFAPTRHYIPCWAVRVEAEGRVFAFSADTGPGASLAPLARDADLFICESSVSGRAAEPQNWGHMAPDEAGALARASHARRLVLTHIWHAYDRPGMRAAAAAAFGGPTELAEEGQVYTI